MSSVLTRARNYKRLRLGGRAFQRKQLVKKHRHSSQCKGRTSKPVWLEHKSKGAQYVTSLERCVEARLLKGFNCQRSLKLILVTSELLKLLDQGSDMVKFAFNIVS